MLAGPGNMTFTLGNLAVDQVICNDVVPSPMSFCVGSGNYSGTMQVGFSVPAFATDTIAVDIDNVMLSDDPSCPNTSMFVNGDFATMDLTGWTALNFGPPSPFTDSVMFDSPDYFLRVSGWNPIVRYHQEVLVPDFADPALVVSMRRPFPHNAGVDEQDCGVSSVWAGVVIDDGTNTGTQAFVQLEQLIGDRDASDNSWRSYSVCMGAWAGQVISIALSTEDVCGGSGPPWENITFDWKDLSFTDDVGCEMPPAAP